MLIDTIRFGQVDIDPQKVITFTEGLPGLEEHKTYSVLQFEEGNPILWLQCTTAPEVCLPVIDSFLADSGYAFNIDDTDVAGLEIKSPEEIHTVSVLVIPEHIADMTANMAAPIVINMRTNRAKQIMLGGGEYNVRYPIFARICALIKESEGGAGAVAENK